MKSLRLNVIRAFLCCFSFTLIESFSPYQCIDSNKILEINQNIIKYYGNFKQTFLHTEQGDYKFWCNYVANELEFVENLNKVSEELSKLELDSQLEDYFSEKNINENSLSYMRPCKGFFDRALDRLNSENNVCNEVFGIYTREMTAFHQSAEDIKLISNQHILKLSNPDELDQNIATEVNEILKKNIIVSCERKVFQAEGEIILISEVKKAIKDKCKDLPESINIFGFILIMIDEDIDVNSAKHILMFAPFIQKLKSTAITDNNLAGSCILMLKLPKISNHIYPFKDSLPLTEPVYVVAENVYEYMRIGKGSNLQCSEHNATIHLLKRYLSPYKDKLLKSIQHLNVDTKVEFINQINLCKAFNGKLEPGDVIQFGKLNDVKRFVGKDIDKLYNSMVRRIEDNRTPFEKSNSYKLLNYLRSIVLLNYFGKKNYRSDRFSVNLDKNVFRKIVENVKDGSVAELIKYAKEKLSRTKDLKRDIIRSISPYGTSRTLESELNQMTYRNQNIGSNMELLTDYTTANLLLALYETLPIFENCNVDQFLMVCEPIKLRCPSYYNYDILANENRILNIQITEINKNKEIIPWAEQFTAVLELIRDTKPTGTKLQKVKKIIKKRIDILKNHPNPKFNEIMSIYEQLEIMSNMISVLIFDENKVYKSKELFIKMAESIQKNRNSSDNGLYRLMCSYSSTFLPALVITQNSYVAETDFLKLLSDFPDRLQEISFGFLRSPKPYWRAIYELKRYFKKVIIYQEKFLIQLRFVEIVECLDILKKFPNTNIIKELETVIKNQILFNLLNEKYASAGDPADDLYFYDMPSRAADVWKVDSTNNRT